ncbi:MAG: HD domain-containing protein [Treponema sp.]|nr:HD domain-containing protein [Treponema sp.]
MNGSVMDVLREGYSRPIRDVLWGHVYLSPGMEALTGAAAFMRLHRIFQLGPTYCAYPGATHTRAGHSIGVYYLSRRLLLQLAEQGADKWLSPSGARSFICAGLLHDLGHFPYAHSLKELPLKSHEKLTGEAIRAEPLRSLIGKAGAEPDLCAAIVDTSLPVDSDEIGFYRKLLSGALDPDKLDYLNRDARYCGVPYGAQDVDFILSRLSPHPERGVDIDSRGIPSVESILFSKYLMYRTVYWHHVVRSATAMIKKSLLSGLEGKFLAPEELYGLDDQGLFSLLETRRYPLASLGARVRDGSLYVLGAGIPFSVEKHHLLQDISRRSRHEEALAAALSSETGKKIPPEALIIDIPEPVSFETGLFVRDEGKAFAESSSAFRPGLVKSFIKSLHIIRIFMDSEAGFGLNLKTELYKVLHNEENWLHL